MLDETPPLGVAWRRGAAGSLGVGAGGHSAATARWSRQSSCWPRYPRWSRRWRCCSPGCCCGVERPGPRPRPRRAPLRPRPLELPRRQSLQSPAPRSPHRRDRASQSAWRNQRSPRRRNQRPRGGRYVPRSPWGPREGTYEPAGWTCPGRAELVAGRKGGFLRLGRSILPQSASKCLALELSSLPPQPGPPGPFKALDTLSCSTLLLPPLLPTLA